MAKEEVEVEVDGNDFFRVGYYYHDKKTSRSNGNCYVL